MRFLNSIFGGISFERPPFMSNLSLANRTFLLGIPILFAILALVFFFTGRNVEQMVESAITRSAILQAQAMGFALENVLRETRAQLLLLASGGIDEQKIARALMVHAGRDGETFREAAFIGLTPEDRFLLVNHKGKIVKVPASVGRDAPSGPFQATGRQLPPRHVNISRPLEVSYAMLPVAENPENIVFHALRFSTPVHDENGIFKGVLSLALDLGALRDRLTLFQDLGYAMPSFFFDNAGWLLFQAGGEPGAPLTSDEVRAGFHGDFGRPGFSRAFRPAPDHLNYWTMVAEVQAQNSGLIPLPINASANGANFFISGGASYAPVMWQPHESQPSQVIGGVALLNDSITGAVTGQHLFRIYSLGFIAALGLSGLFLWYLTRTVSSPLKLVSDQIAMRNAANTDQTLTLTKMPGEFERLRQEVDALLLRLKCARAAIGAQTDAKSQQWLRKAAPLPIEAAGPARLVGDSAPMRSLRAQIEKVASVNADILITGETGTGKELVATSIHNLSGRRDGPFLSINCGALDETLLMDTLFGHVRGAFTEAKSDRKGAFLAASGGTLLLDEIGNATPKVQQALLRALSTRKIRPLGSDTDLDYDTRIIAATNAELLASASNFRSDLYYRLAVITLQTPPLRNHKEDIPCLVSYFLASEKIHGRNLKISRGALEILLQREWPGNVRELKNVLTRAMAFCLTDLVMAEDMQDMAQETQKISTYASLPAFSQPDIVSEPSGLNPRQQAMWEKIVTYNSFSRQDYMAMSPSRVSARTAQYDLKFMIQLGLLRKEGRGPGLRYIVIKKTEAANG